MKKLLQMITALALLAAFGVAQALPITDVHVANFQLSYGSEYRYSHDLVADHGFDPLTDIIISALLTLDISGPNGQSLSVGLGGATPTGYTLGFLGSNDLVVSILNLQLDGVLDVVLKHVGPGKGTNFTLKSSTLHVNGNDTVAVPEPSSLAILGLGLLGIAGARRLRNRIDHRS